MFENRREYLNNLLNIETLILRGEPPEQKHSSLYFETLESWCAQIPTGTLNEKELLPFLVTCVSASENLRTLEILANTFMEIERREPGLFEDIQLVSKLFAEKVLAFDKENLSGVVEESTIQAIAKRCTSASAQALAQIAAGKIPLPKKNAEILRTRAVEALGTFGSMALPFISGIEQFVYEKGILAGDNSILSSGIAVAHTIENDELSRRELLGYPVFGFTEFPGEATSTPEVTPGDLQSDMRFKFIANDLPSECRIRLYFSILEEPIIVLSQDKLSFGHSIKEQISTHIARLTMFMGAESLPRIFEISPNSDVSPARELNVSLTDHSVRTLYEGFEPNHLFETQFGIRSPGFIEY